jgi:hypothetical protein
MAEDSKNPALALKPVTMKGVVARGRTITAPHPSKRTLAYHHPETGKAIMRPEMLEFGPGAEIELTEDEIVSLRTRGFLTDPSKVLQPVAEGSHVSEVGSQQSVKAA